jgi:NAD(P)-dependent dehydrogenase (short-subunit alcohol dehydrogenase family)
MDDAIVAAFTSSMREQHGGVDILVSNAAARISLELSPAAQVAMFVNTNNHSTARMR